MVWYSLKTAGGKVESSMPTAREDCDARITKKNKE
jgi:hypothetical protein